MALRYASTWRYGLHTFMPARIQLLLLIVGCLFWAGCVHHIHVNPLPVTRAAITIPRVIQLDVRPVTMVGADHRQSIALLDWPQRDIHQAVHDYVRERGTFTSVSMDPSDLTLAIATKLLMTSRQGRYHYQIMLQAEMKEATQIKKSYHVEQTAVGSSVRWVTTSDRDPIETALKLALEDVMNQIEGDRLLYLPTAGNSHPSGNQTTTSSAK